MEPYQGGLTVIHLMRSEGLWPSGGAVELQILCFLQDYANQIVGVLELRKSIEEVHRVTCDTYPCHYLLRKREYLRWC